MPVYKGVNKDFFKSWNNKSAYVLGFLFADGSLETNSRGSRYFSIQITDRELLGMVRSALSAEHKISKRLSNRGHRPLYRLQIGSKEMHSDLLRLGLSEKKSQTMDFPDVPRQYLPHFVRGFFDGDGNVWVGHVHKDRNRSHEVIQTTFTSASKVFLEGLKSALESVDIYGSLACRKTYCRLSYSVLASISLYRFMYEDSEVSMFLPRKQRVFERFIEKRT